MNKKNRIVKTFERYFNDENEDYEEDDEDVKLSIDELKELYPGIYYDGEEMCEHDFVVQFRQDMYGNAFTDAELRAMCDYYYDLTRDTGKSIDYDVTAMSLEWHGCDDIDDVYDLIDIDDDYDIEGYDDMDYEE